MFVHHIHAIACIKHFCLNLQEGEYMLNRAPELFDKIRVFIDRFHAMGHLCCEGFKLANYPEFHALVSTSAESLNSFMQHFHSQVAFMNQATFMQFMLFVLGVRNWMINQLLAQLMAMYKN